MAIRNLFHEVMAADVLIVDEESETALLLKEALKGVSFLPLNDIPEVDLPAVYSLDEMFEAALEHINTIGLDKFIERISDSFDKLFFARFWKYCTGNKVDHNFTIKWVDHPNEGFCLVEQNQKLNYRSRSQRDIQVYQVPKAELSYVRMPDAPDKYEQFEIIIYALEDLLNAMKDSELSRKHLFTMPSCMDTLAVMVSLMGVTETRVGNEDELINSTIQYKTRNIGLGDNGEQLTETDIQYKIDRLYSNQQAIVKYPTSPSEQIAIEQIAVKTVKTLSIHGLRHLIALLLAFDLNGRRRILNWDVNDHLDLLGYKRKKDGSHDYRNKQKAIEVIRVITQAEIIVKQADFTSTKKVRVIKLFTVWDYDAVLINGDEPKPDPDSGKMTIEVHPWYPESYHPTAKNLSPQFTQLLKEIVSIDPRKHGIAIFLSALLSIYWRMNISRKIGAGKLLSWCDLPESKKNIQRLERELEYMRMKDFIGEWTHDGEAGKLPSESSDPYAVVLTLNPPRWFLTRLQSFKSGKLPEIQSRKNTLNVTELEALMAAYSIRSKAKAAELLEVSRAFMSMVFAGKKKVPSYWTQEYVERRFRKYRRGTGDKKAG